jgi:hypothetical protein
VAPASPNAPLAVPDIGELRIDEPGAKAEQVQDLDLSGLNGVRDERPRFADAPAAPAGDVPVDITFESVPAVLVPTTRPRATRRVRNRPWPLILAVIAGLVVGGAAGYWLGLHQGAQRTALRPGTAPSPTELPAQPLSVPAAQAPSPSPVAAAAAPAEPPTPAAAATPGARGNTAPATAAAAVNLQLTIKSVPTGAVVTINGRRRGVTPLTLNDVEAGHYAVRVSRRAYATEEREVVLSAEHPAAALTVTLGRIRPPKAETLVGSLSVQSQPPGARVTLDGRAVGTTPVVVASVAAGSHVVRVSLEGFRQWTQTVEIVAGQRLRVTSALERGDQ